VIDKMVSEGRGRLFRRSDGKFLIYLPKDMAEDSAFPFKDWESSSRSALGAHIRVKVSFDPNSQEKLLVIEPWSEEA